MAALFARVFALLVIAHSALGRGLQDNPIEGTSLQYLDGSDWTAEATIVVWNKTGCTFEANVDYNEGVGTCPYTGATSKEECCAICASHPDCFAGVLYQESCYLKTISDSFHKAPTTLPTIACVPQMQSTPIRPLEISATVPGDLVSDLFNAGIIPDPLSDMVWRDYSMYWDGQLWTYTKKFDLTGAVASATTLVFDGVKMAANVSLNGVFLGTLQNQFLRYSFDVSRVITARANVLQVVFDYRYDPGVNGRFMACTGGWDWAPVSTTVDIWGHPTFTRGIWKSVYLVGAADVTVTHVVPQIVYTGPYPNQPLKNGAQAPFNVTVRVTLSSPVAVSGTLSAVGEWDPQHPATATVTVGPGVVERDIFLQAAGVDLWWPTLHGAQKLYNLTISFTSSQSHSTVAAVRRVGFRVLALVTNNDTVAQPPTEGTSNFTLMFRVNGGALWVRGANMIPMEELEGRADAGALRRLMQSAAEANFNMLRIWGGGIFQYDEFYDAADELGILLFHDMQYAQQGHNPDATDPLQKRELIHQVSRLSHHPCIAVWDGCNECGGLGVYASFVMTTVASADASRPIWPSCPANGWQTGVDSLYSRPNGNALAAKSSGGPAESHGPYVPGNGWCTDEEAFWDVCTLKMFTPAMLPAQQQQPTGVGAARGNFRSEFGCSVWASFESISAVLNPSDWGLHTPAMFERNWPVDNIVQSYFGWKNLNLTGAVNFKRQLYQSMLAQMLYIKQQVEDVRATNNFGTLIWQYNEIWPTGGWGSIEYGSRRPGQVVGGRWKLLHYWLKETIYPDVVSSCSWSGKCYVRSDAKLAVRGTVKVSLVSLTSSALLSVSSAEFSLPPGPAQTQWFCLMTDCRPLSDVLTAHSCAASGSDCILSIIVEDINGVKLSSNVAPLLPPSNLTMPVTTVTFEVEDIPNPDGSINITLSSTPSVALFVVLTTQASGRFSHNGFVVLPDRPTVLQFIPWEPLDVPLKDTLRLEHLQPNL